MVRVVDVLRGSPAIVVDENNLDPLDVGNELRIN